MISLEKLKILRPLIFFSKNVGYLSKKLLPKALKSCPKSNKFYNLVTLVTTIYLVTPSTRVPMFWETGSETSSGFTLTCSILLICIQNGSERRFQTFRRSRRRRRSHCRWRWRHLLNFYFLHKNDFFCDEIWRPYSHELSQSEKVWPDSTVICLIFGNFQQWKFAQQYKSLLNLVEILTNYYLNLPSRNRLRLLKNSQNGKILPNLVPLIRSCVGIGGGKTDLKTF